MASPAAAYAAVTRGYAQWWTPASDPFDAVGDEAIFRFGDTSWTFRATEIAVNRTVTLECTAADHHHDGLPTSIREEWLGSRLRWQITQTDPGARITLIHQGLTPELTCYNICAKGWDFYFLQSLPRYLNEGVGMPYRPGD